ncbi:hypothetical protein J437_LFUL017594 [Ladona fulva]|uniref:Helicase ATP-binding domain-containing protein n=1 Tax=Ladona fulva TaxID=123851 RepID=A0A8K0KPF7_LADFU|nr:hypothetical protein J437_LFUL017594 [Ladona fulva]
MPEIIINGIPVNFPFEPYDVQKDYMARVIQCLQNGHNGILESPTGTGKTLSLLCSSIAWLMMCKAKTQAESLGISEDDLCKGPDRMKFLSSGFSAAGNVKVEPYAWVLFILSCVSYTICMFLIRIGGTPKIYYASRTHSQLTQAIQELKRTAYAHVRSAVLGSRDQMCIHPEVSREPTNTGKVHMCHHRVSNRTCHFFNNVEARKGDSTFKDSGPMDIEDLVKAGRKLQCCPYFMAKEIKQEADIVFMPYNYILDPKSRKANGIELENKVVILDEAHNIEKMCEESASLALSSTDLALCIDEVTKVMKEFGDLTEMSAQVFNSGEDNLKDFTMEELCILKTLFLKLEDAVDSISVKESQNNDMTGETFPGSFMVDLLAKVGITNDKKLIVIDLLDKIIQYLTTSSMAAEGGSTSFQRKGNGLQLFSDLLKVVFINTWKVSRDATRQVYVHVMVEDAKKKRKADSWAAMKAATFNPYFYLCLFRMQTLVEQHMRSLILTSGTLAPLPPLISELGIPVNVTLENPHIIESHQVWLGVVKNGPDGYPLSSAYSSRDIWQQTGVWSRIQERKPIFVEPQSREGLNSAMAEFYAKVKDPETSGACFMAVCRGKRTMSQSGQEWYNLEASRAVNQAIGRVIRHSKDFGAILLCDKRFDSPHFKNELSAWLRPHFKSFSNFGEVVRGMRSFFKNAETMVSEGLDFADHNGRAVVVTGLPFPPYKDPRVILKRSYLDEARKNRSLNED